MCLRPLPPGPNDARPALQWEAANRLRGGYSSFSEQFISRAHRDPPPPTIYDSCLTPASLLLRPPPRSPRILGLHPPPHSRVPYGQVSQCWITTRTRLNSAYVRAGTTPGPMALRRPMISKRSMPLRLSHAVGLVFNYGGGCGRPYAWCYRLVWKG